MAGARGGGGPGCGRSAASVCPPAASANAPAINKRFMELIPVVTRDRDGPPSKYKKEYPNPLQLFPLGV